MSIGTEVSEKFNEVKVSQRSVARLAAVQALYQLELLGSDVNELIEEYVNHRLGKENDEDQPMADADPGWFKMIVTGVKEEQRYIDPLISKVLKESWTLKRIDSTLRAILRAGVFELHKRRDVPAKIVISEYLKLTNAFYEETEQHLVNGILDNIAHEIRPEEFESPEQVDSGRV